MGACAAPETRHAAPRDCTNEHGVSLVGGTIVEMIWSYDRKARRPWNNTMYVLLPEQAGNNIGGAIVIVNSKTICAPEPLEYSEIIDEFLYWCVGCLITSMAIYDTHDFDLTVSRQDMNQPPQLRTLTFQQTRFYQWPIKLGSLEHNNLLQKKTSLFL